MSHENEMKISFICYPPSTFVKQDFEILSRHFQVDAVPYRSAGDIIHMIGSIRRSDIVFSWFASGHSFAAVMLAKIFRKRSAVVAGGYDVAFEPEINYGQYTLARHKRMYADFALNRADAILAVSEFTKEEVLARSKPRRVEVVYNGIDTDTFRPMGEKEDLVLTVASGSNDVIRLKGLDVFVKAAGYHPDLKFLVLGLSDADRKTLASCCSSSNVDLRGIVSRQELIGYYQRAKVYCQLSYRESFGVALAEAMACGCTPVVTEKAALPEVVDDAGFYVPYGDPESTAKAILLALRSDKGEKARDRVERYFEIGKREEILISIIWGLIREKRK
jgi:glycosyltransferase involved in cell wall biosynthesis